MKTDRTEATGAPDCSRLHGRRLADGPQAGRVVGAAARDGQPRGCWALSGWRVHADAGCRLRAHRGFGDDWRHDEVSHWLQILRADRSDYLAARPRGPVDATGGPTLRGDLRIVSFLAASGCDPRVHAQGVRCQLHPFPGGALRATMRTRLWRVLYGCREIARLAHPGRQ